MIVEKNEIIGEATYTEKLENGLEVVIVPKKGVRKKYIIWATHFGSVDNKFVIPGTDKVREIPDGVAHFLEHKMFEQESGVDALYSMMALGLNANAYTTFDHTAYLFECTDHFYEGLDILMDYVQHPYFTKENVEKEQGIIGQEIMMYDDDPVWQCYINAMKCLYKNSPIRIDTAGTVETISHITPEILFDCYNTFYNPSNMTLVVCGDFDPEDLLEEIKKRLLPVAKNPEIKRIYPEEPEEIYEKEKECQMEISMPLFIIGFKDKIETNKDEIVKRHTGIKILLDLIAGEGSRFYKEMYEEGLLLAPLDLDYEFSDTFAHVIITAQSPYPKKVEERLMNEIERIKEEGIDSRHFEIAKRKMYGAYVNEYESVSDIARSIVVDKIKGIKNSFDYLNIFSYINYEYINSILDSLLKNDNEVISIVNPKVV